jgi:hypothetical protein
MEVKCSAETSVDIPTSHLLHAGFLLICDPEDGGDTFAETSVDVLN